MKWIGGFKFWFAGTLFIIPLFLLLCICGAMNLAGIIVGVWVCLGAIRFGVEVIKED